MTCVGDRRWTLDFGFVRQGGAIIDCPFTGKKERLTWSIRSFSTRFLPFSLIECRMDGMGLRTFGYGDSIFFKNSLTRAFSESWERFWMKRLYSRGFRFPGDLRNSNGFACGSSREQALESARGELIERAVFLRAWNTMKGWIEIPIQGLLNHILTAALWSRGLRLKLFRIQEVMLGDVVCGLGFKDGGGFHFDSCYCKKGVSVRDAQTKVLRSLLRAAVGEFEENASIETLPFKGRPDDHRAYYRDARHAAAFAFLQRQDDSHGIELGYYDEIHSKILVDIEGFPFLAFASNPQWPQLCWGRESLQRDGNPWPHPLV